MSNNEFAKIGKKNRIERTKIFKVNFLVYSNRS